ncbi:MAG TPA: glycoside hydrolase family 3 N-terminal domain-containing protein [Steroidobacteraceae bacterium]|nr:glycoside hydrolase family 3 N-terminal domain-containing protein [Steroidobacteraceae bacterium]
MTRIERLLAAMSLEEKIGQLNMAAATRVVTGPGGPTAVEEGVRAGRIGSLLNLWGAEEVGALQRLAVEESRHGIPLLLGLDVIHGHRTIFPVPLAEACLFDPDVWERTARAAAAEAADDGITLTFAPMIDVARDARWGRIVEGPGEDPWVASQYAVAKTRGFQGRDLSCAASVAATAKHLCAYGAVTAGREYAGVDVAERTLHEVYLPPFAAAVAAGVAAIMPALTDVAGVPMTANAALLQGWLRGELGFRGVVISDYNAIAELRNHGVAADDAHAAALALGAGVDVDMASGAYVRGLPVALERGLINVTDIDDSVRRVLTLKECLGLFDNPYRRGALEPPGAAMRELAREAARRAIVLLTHRERVLPLPPDLRRIALIGPLAAAEDDMLGPWAAAGRGRKTVSILAGLRDALPGCNIDTLPGVGISGTDTRGIPAAIERCRAAELIILCVGEGAEMSGEAASRADLGLPGCQRALAEAALELGKPVVALLCAGRPLTLPWLFERAAAVLATWFLGSESGHAIADVLTGRFNPSGRLPVTWPRHGGQLPMFYGERPSGRPPKAGERFSSSYLDVPVTPQFPFGHGLSYSRFTLSDLRCTPEQLEADQCLEVSVTVHNESSVRGQALLFLFFRDPVASIARPVLELRGLRRIVVEPGQRERVSWILPAQELAFMGPRFDRVLEPGRFEIHVGQSADRAELLSSSIELIS